MFREAAKKLAWTALEARLVSTPLRYAFRELVHPTLADYSLRGGGHIALRHRSGDVDIFRKFYAYRYYEWLADFDAEFRALARPVNGSSTLGANDLLFEVHARNQLPIGSVVCFEPDPANADVLERVRDANGATWRVIRACASNRTATNRS